MREEREKRAVLGVGFGMSGSRRDTLGILGLVRVRRWPG
jgi:hypothetical protein